MAHESPKRIRNVALVGHRGSGKTSTCEALLFEAGATNRLGAVADGTTVSDWASDEKAREMSISLSLCSFGWQDRKINLIDTPGEPSFVADSLAALRVCEGAVFVVNGVMGVEVTTDRLWHRAEDLGLARLIFVNMRDRDPDRHRARPRGRDRPDRHEGLPLPERRPRGRRGDRDPGRPACPGRRV